MYYLPQRVQRGVWVVLRGSGNGEGGGSEEEDMGGWGVVV